MAEWAKFKPFEQGVQMRFAIVLMMTLLITLIVTIVPNKVFTHFLLIGGSTLAGSPRETRGGTLSQSYQSTSETNFEFSSIRERLNEDERRLNQIEQQHYDSHIAVIESRLETMFELGRIVLGAAGIYLIQVFGSAALWVVRRQKANPLETGG